MEIRFACFILLMVLLTGCDMHIIYPTAAKCYKQERTMLFQILLILDQSVHHAYLTYSFVSTDSDTTYHEYHNG